MCNPAAIVMAVGAAVSAAGQIQAGQAQNKMANYNARLAEDSARFQAERQRDRTERLMGAARVAVNKSGIAASGSPLDLLADSAMQAELDHRAILRQGAAQAGLDRYQGSATARSGYFGAAATLLQGAGRAYGALGDMAAVDAGRNAGLGSNGIYWFTPRQGASPA